MTARFQPEWLDKRMEVPLLRQGILVKGTGFYRRVIKKCSATLTTLV